MDHDVVCPICGARYPCEYRDCSWDRDHEGECSECIEQELYYEEEEEEDYYD